MVAEGEVVLEGEVVAASCCCAASRSAAALGDLGDLGDLGGVRALPEGGGFHLEEVEARSLFGDAATAAKDTAAPAGFPAPLPLAEAKAPGVLVTSRAELARFGFAGGIAGAFGSAALRAAAAGALGDAVGGDAVAGVLLRAAGGSEGFLEEGTAAANWADGDGAFGLGGAALGGDRGGG